MTTKTVFSKEEVQRIKKQWLDDDRAASAADLIQMAGQAALQSPEIQQLRKDAERYRWLRDVSVPPHNFYVSVPVEFEGVKYKPFEVDAYIDAAMEVKP